MVERRKGWREVLEGRDTDGGGAYIETDGRPGEEEKDRRRKEIRREGRKEGAGMRGKDGRREERSGDRKWG